MMKQILGIGILAVLLAGCDQPPAEVEELEKVVSAEVEMVVERVTLTVAEGKRLIARGLAKYAPVVEKMGSGTVIVCRGSSNTYLAEELLKTNLLHGAFLTGRIQPEGSAPLPVTTSVGEIVIRNGVWAPETQFIKGLRAMQPGDIIFKGANLVNYADRTAAVCIGHPTGGTMGMFLPFVEEQGVRLIIPVGLEKQTSQDLAELETVSRADHELNKRVPWLKLLPGEIFTEIEAIQQIAEVEVYQLASGGIAGAEGAVTLALKGAAEEVEKALAAVSAAQGEPPF
ncbi:MAG: hypothetical protein ISR84_02405 [Kiritimatiellales bacterium]|nr:hypothetical protein [Kiritimatiellales bacterium]